jgi:hypothetical protein
MALPLPGNGFGTGIQRPAEPRRLQGRAFGQKACHFVGAGNVDVEDSTRRLSGMRVFTRASNHT